MYSYYHDKLIQHSLITFFITNDALHSHSTRSVYILNLIEQIMVNFVQDIGELLYGTIYRVRLET